MPIRQQGPRLLDDARTFEAEDLTEIWEWLDSFDSQPLSAWNKARLVRPPWTFEQGRYIFRGRIYSVAQCSDGRELLGSVIGMITEPMRPPGNRILALLPES